ncbi:MAG: hypothetical protein ACP5PA_06285 [Elusimicrobiales bacterium]
MGSVVKSNEWEIDRAKNKEYFTGNVFFENRYYLFKSSSAVYDHTLKRWSVEGNVYCRKKIEKNKYLEVFCDAAVYDEDIQKALLYSGNQKIKIKYTESSSQTHTAYSKNASIDLKERNINFDEEFELFSSSVLAKSGRAIYYETKDAFIMRERPIINAITDDYNLHIKGDEITLFRNEKVAIVKSSVYGAIYRREK